MLRDSSALRLPFNGMVSMMLAVFMMFWLSACSVPPSSTSSTLPAQTDGATAAGQIDPFAYQACIYPPNGMLQACRAKGGTFLQQGRLGCYECVVTYSDAGKACQDGADCQGSCRNAGEFMDARATNQSGQCASDSSRFGCYQTIEKGVAQHAICVD